MAGSTSAEAAKPEPRQKRAPKQRQNPFAGIIQFFREVFIELGKVVTPTWKQLINYTIVVLVFVVLMMLLVFGLDALSAWIMAWVFGDGLTF